LSKADPRLSLARLVARLERRKAFVTMADIEAAATRRSNRSVPAQQLGQLVEAAVADCLLLADHRTFFDRDSQTFETRYVYRVNRRHPLVRSKGPELRV